MWGGGEAGGVRWAQERKGLVILDGGGHGPHDA